MGLKFKTEPPIGDLRPHDKTIAELAQHPGEWAMVYETDEDRDARNRARTLRRKGALCRIRVVDGNPQVWACVE